MTFDVQELMLISRALSHYGNLMRDREMAEIAIGIKSAFRAEARAAIKLKQRIAGLEIPPVNPLTVFAGDDDPRPAA